VTCVSWGSDILGGDFVAVRAEPTCISIFDLTPIQWLNVKLSSQRDNNTSVSWSADGRFLARTKGSRVVISDSVNHFTDVASLELKEKIKNVAFCPSREKGDFLACVGLDGNVVLMQLISQGNTISLVMVKSTFLEENLWVLAWMPDGDLIATGGRGKKLFLLSSSQMTPI